MGIAVRGRSDTDLKEVATSSPEQNTEPNLPSTYGLGTQVTRGKESLQQFRCYTKANKRQNKRQNRLKQRSQIVENTSGTQEIEKQNAMEGTLGKEKESKETTTS
jgi:hypothetical protein